MGLELTWPNEFFMTCAWKSWWFEAVPTCWYWTMNWLQL